MQTIFEEIRADCESALEAEDAMHIDSEYLTAAAIGIAREIGDHMLQRRPVDVEYATEFSTTMLLSGFAGAPPRTPD